MFLFLPYGAELRLNYVPYVSFFIAILCVIVFLFQISSDKTLTHATQNYCDSIYSDNYEEVDELDVLSLNKHNCVPVLMFLYSREDKGAFETFEKKLKSSPLYNFDEAEINEVLDITREHVREFAATAPKRLTEKLLDYPNEFNPFTMLSAAISHGSWGHIIFNLFFFLAFAPAIEVLIQNRLKFFLILVSIAVITSLSYSLFILLGQKDPIPTLGLSGVVMGMIGLAAFLMPHARIKVFLWFFTVIKTVYVPAWLLALWYIGWDTWDVFTRDDFGGVNLISHVSGGFAGFLIGYFFLKERRDETHEELMAEVEAMKLERTASSSPYDSKAGRREIQQRFEEKEAKKQQSNFMNKLYRCVQTNRESEAIILFIETYNLETTDIKQIESLFTEMKSWGHSRLMLCIGRLIIHYYLKQRNFAMALQYVEQCQKIMPMFVLAHPAHVLFLSQLAANNHLYDVAYNLVHEIKRRHGEYVDQQQSVVFEIQLLIEHLHRPNDAKRLIQSHLPAAKGEFKEKLTGLNDLIS